MKFRKKPIVIEAERNDTGEPICIKTLEGEMLAMPGDWIITGIKGERYPCKPDIFEKTYELVNQGPIPAACSRCDGTGMDPETDDCACDCCGGSGAEEVE